MNPEILVEELSAERALGVLLPRIIPGIDFGIHVFRGKTDLLKKLPHRLKGYSDWITREDTYLVVLVDRDDDDCLALKAHMEQVATAAGLSTATAASASRRVRSRPQQRLRNT